MLSTLIATPSYEAVSSVAVCFAGSVHFAVPADQVFQPIDSFRLWNIEFRRGLADAEVRLTGAPPT
jgi:hypothetical protein